MEQVEVLLLYAPGSADAIVAQFGGLVGCVPTLEDQFKLGRQVILRVALEPARLDHAATSGAGACWYWPAKLYSPCVSPDELQNFQRFPILQPLENPKVQPVSPARGRFSLLA